MSDDDPGHGDGTVWINDLPGRVEPAEVTHPFGHGVIVDLRPERRRFGDARRMGAAAAAVAGAILVVLVTVPAFSGYRGPGLAGPSPAAFPGEIADRGQIAYCAPLATIDWARIELAIDAMTNAGNGAEHLALLREHDVCVAVKSLGWAAAQFRPRTDGSLTVVLDAQTVLTASADELAAILVHEAAHVQRWVEGRDCSLTDQCLRDWYGMTFSEELPAYSAAADWWRARFGAGGAGVTEMLNGSWITAFYNDLLEHHVRGPEAFATYLRTVWDRPSVQNVFAAPTNVPATPYTSLGS